VRTLGRLAFSISTCVSLLARPVMPPPTWSGALRGAKAVCIVEIIRWAEPRNVDAQELLLVEDLVACKCVEVLRGDRSNEGRTLWVHRYRRSDGWCGGPGLTPPPRPKLTKQKTGTRMIVFIQDDTLLPDRDRRIQSVVGGDYGWIPCIPRNLDDVKSALRGADPVTEFHPLRDRLD